MTKSQGLSILGCHLDFLTPLAHLEVDCSYFGHTFVAVMKNNDNVDSPTTFSNSYKPLSTGSSQAGGGVSLHQDNSAVNNARSSFQFEYTPEELQVIKDCNKESFWSRCVPISAVMAITIKTLEHFSIMSRPKQLIGHTLQLVGVCACGLIAGKLSYVSECKRKIMEIVPDGSLARMVSQRKNGLIDSMSPASLPSIIGQRTRGSPAKLELDTEHQEIQGLDDNLRPNVDGSSQQSVKDNSSPSRASFVTHEELRAKNRQSAAQLPQANASQQRGSTQPQKKPVYNQYGDQIDE